MSSPALFLDLDRQDRQAAIDPTRSFIVQAPAGSGKTELLIQRYLRLLSTVDRPESIVAITFTRKAAAEMAERIVKALQDAAAGITPEKPHEAFTAELARAALDRDRARGWNLIQHPSRMRVQTIDSLCMAIVGDMPWMARLGGVPEIQDDARDMFQEAARRTVLMIGTDGPHRESLETLLRHLDNSASRLRDLIAAMLANRDQWISMAVQTADEEREALEDTMHDVVSTAWEKVTRLVPVKLQGEWVEHARFAAANLDEDSPFAPARDLLHWPEPWPGNLPVWLALTELVLKKDGFREKLNKNQGFPPASATRRQACEMMIGKLAAIGGLGEALAAIRKLPPIRYTDEQWMVMRALFETLKLSVAQLREVFRQERTVDFGEISQAARYALGSFDEPTELAFQWDSRTQHLLIDEFQDTSRGQFELLLKLIMGWQPGDGRTLFLVGDPMQSIYRFRQAEVGLFLEVQKRGLAALLPEKLTLLVNYRSTEQIVSRVNQLFKPMFPYQDDLELGAIQYSPSYTPDAGALAREAAAKDSAAKMSLVTVDSFGIEKNDAPWVQDQAEADRVLQLVGQARALDPVGSIAILVRARTHLPAILSTLKAAGFRYRAVEIDPLSERSIVSDLLALTKAMLLRADRVSWLAILRAPWCGLTLPDLQALVEREPKDRLMWEILGEVHADANQAARLSADGRARLACVTQVLAAAFAEQARWPLRQWVERTWVAVGGPKCLEQNASALSDAMDFFDLLERRQTGADLRDLSLFERQLQDLYARPGNEADSGAGSIRGSIDVMTIHKAKGLEFDTVILPGLGRTEKQDETQLFLFHEWSPESGEVKRLLAPIRETGTDDDPFGAYLKRINDQKNQFERVRLLYVAATRARKRLHFLGQVRINKSGIKPDSRSMMADLWNQLSPEEVEKQRQKITANRPVSGAPTVLSRPTRVQWLRRLPDTWRGLEFPTAGKAAESTAAADPSEPMPEQPTFDWVRRNLRIVGTVMHALLQKAGGETEFAIPSEFLIRKVLAQAGIVPSELDPVALTLRQTFDRIQRSPRARWIFSPRKSTATEYAMTGFVDGQLVRGTVDRTFLDEDPGQPPVRWIVDFKTSAHQGGSLEHFLDEEQRRYRPQLERYGRLMAGSGDPVRVGLYFPLLDAWREWPILVPDQGQ